MQEEKQIGCLALRCLGLLGGAWRAFVWFSRIIGFQMPAETSLMKKKKKKEKKERNLSNASLSKHSGSCGKTRYHPWYLCLGGDSLFKQE